MSIVNFCNGHFAVEHLSAICLLELGHHFAQSLKTLGLAKRHAMLVYISALRLLNEVKRVFARHDYPHTRPLNLVVFLVRSSLFCG